MAVLKRVRGSSGITDRMKDTKEGVSIAAEYHRGLLDNSIENINQAFPGGDQDAALEGLDKEVKRNDALLVRAERLWMGQVRDPLQLKEMTIEQTMEKYWPTSTKHASIRARIIWHIAEPLGIGGSKAKLVYSPPR